jgi:hypothetical protein
MLPSQVNPCGRRWLAAHRGRVEARTFRLQRILHVHSAHASRYHWGAAGDADEAVNLARGEWPCSRVYAILGHF